MPEAPKRRPGFRDRRDVRVDHGLWYLAEPLEIVSMTDAMIWLSTSLLKRTVFGSILERRESGDVCCWRFCNQRAGSAIKPLGVFACHRGY